MNVRRLDMPGDPHGSLTAVDTAALIASKTVFLMRWLLACEQVAMTTVPLDPGVQLVIQSV